MTEKEHEQKKMKQKLGELIFQTKLSSKELKRLENQNKELEYQNKVSFTNPYHSITKLIYFRC